MCLVSTVLSTYSSPILSCILHAELRDVSPSETPTFSEGARDTSPMRMEVKLVRRPYEREPARFLGPLLSR